MDTAMFVTMFNLRIYHLWQSNFRNALGGIPAYLSQALGPLLSSPYFQRVEVREYINILSKSA